MMDGRVKTLHPEIHGGILARRHRPDDLEAIAAQGITPVDLVVVNLYPFAEGGAESRHAVRRAGRGDRHRRPEPAPRGREELPRRAGRRRSGRLPARARGARARPGGPTLAFRFELMQKAFAHTAQFDGMIAMTMQQVDVRPAEAMRAVGRRCRRSHGEPKRPALRREPAPEGACGRCRPQNWRSRWQVHQGKELSYTNLLDLDAAAAHRARVHRAGRRRDQAHQSLRRRDRRDLADAYVARARGRSAVRLRRHRRPQPGDRRRRPRGR